nr:uncharacterized protein LOC106629373 [Zonotrichia albicollis]
MAAAGGAGGAAPSARPLGAAPPPPGPPERPRAAGGHGRDTAGAHGPRAASAPFPPRALPTRDRDRDADTDRDTDTHLPHLPARRTGSDRTGRARFGGYRSLPGGAPPRKRCCSSPGREIRLFRPQKTRPGGESVKRGWIPAGIFIPPHGEIGGNIVSVSRKRLEGWGAGAAVTPLRIPGDGFLGGLGVPCPDGGKFPPPRPWSLFPLVLEHPSLPGDEAFPRKKSRQEKFPPPAPRPPPAFPKPCRGPGNITGIQEFPAGMCAWI